MGKGGKYLNKKAAARRKRGKITSIVLLVIAVILALIIGFVAWYVNSLMNLVTRPDAQTKDNATTPAETYNLAEETIPEATVMVEGQIVEETTPEDTWPVIVPDKNISNILVVGQAARAGEEQLIADTMILFSINRETKTITMTSFMRDMRLVWPEFIDKDGKSHTGNNRINMAYNMGSRWRGDSTGGMDLLSSIIEYNFGVPVDHAIEVNFDLVIHAIDILGDVKMELTQEEVDFMQKNYPYMENLVAGENYLDGYQSLCFARLRKVGHGDYERTERQRRLITSILNSLRYAGLMEMHDMFKQILPEIKTNMTNKEITNYAFELIPMIKDLQIQSQRIPYDDNQYTMSVEIDGVIDYQLGCDTKATGKRLRESIGMVDAAE